MQGKLTKSDTTNAAQAVAIGRMNALVSEYVYAIKTPPSWSEDTTSRMCVAPAAMITAGLTSGAYFGIDLMRVLLKTFWAMEMEMAPPRELKKMTNASVGRRS